MSASSHSCLPDSLFGYDVDYLFAYPTAKYVTIQDARLGLFKYFCTFGIVLYVGIYQLWYEGSYLASSAVTGAVRFTLQQPTQNSCDPTYNGCKNEFDDVNTLNYCQQAGPTNYPGNQYPCQFYENIGAQIVMDSSILVATRVTSYEQILVCNDTALNCPNIYNETATATVYVTQPEAFTVLIDHSVLAQSFDLQAQSGTTDGRLYVADNPSLCTSFLNTHASPSTDAVGDDPWSTSSDGACYLAPNETSKGLDFFALDVLMQAAGATLDDINYGEETFRETGATMLLKIDYTNTKPWRGTQDVTYTYAPILMLGSSYKHYDAVYGSYRESRTLLNKHGIFIEAVQGGELRVFSATSLLIQLTTSLALFAIATVITDFAALYLLPDAKVYTEYKYELTEDFSDRRANDITNSNHGGPSPSSKSGLSKGKGLGEPLLGAQQTNIGGGSGSNSGSALESTTAGFLGSGAPGVASVIREPSFSGNAAAEQEGYLQRVATTDHA